MQKTVDLTLTLLLPALIILHLLVAPYTKVEESFPLQAAHDILVYPPPLPLLNSQSTISSALKSNYDHFTFPGAVPRTFLGSFILANVASPLVSLFGNWGSRNAQFVVRAVLGLWNAYCLVRFKKGLETSAGKGVGRWWTLFVASGFHVLFYASRTLPNMFAFGLTTLALEQFLPLPSLSQDQQIQSRARTGIYLLVLSGVIFRAELVALLVPQTIFLLLNTSLSLSNTIATGLISFIISLALSVPLDSFFWQRLLWPEFSSLLFNVYSGKSTEWGVSPWHSYFSSFLPKLLLNPLIIPLIAYSLYLPATRKLATGLAVPSLSFVALYSIQPHKEARFIIYVVPALLGAAALSANYIWTRRAKSLVYKIASIALLGSTALSAAASTGMLFISALNYPGGEALWLLHQLAAQDGKTGEVNVHLDVLSCMTGVSRFMQDSPSPPIWGALPLPIPVPTPSSSSSSSPVNANKEPLVWHYDKTEDSPALLDPSFWSAFDYILTSSPSSVPGTWEVVRTVYGLAGMEILRPGQNVYTVDNSVILGRAKEALRLLTNRAFLEDVEVKGQGSDEVLMDEVGIYGILKETVRRFVTGGWWVGPRMEEKIWILKRVY